MKLGGGRRKNREGKRVVRRSECVVPVRELIRGCILKVFHRGRTDLPPNLHHECHMFPADFSSNQR